jgi:hypothetical protein
MYLLNKLKKLNPIKLTLAKNYYFSTLESQVKSIEITDSCVKVK